MPYYHAGKEHKNLAFFENLGNSVSEIVYNLIQHPSKWFEICDINC